MRTARPRASSFWQPEGYIIRYSVYGGFRGWESPSRSITVTNGRTIKVTTELFSAGACNVRLCVRRRTLHALSCVAYRVCRAGQGRAGQGRAGQGRAGPARQWAPNARRPPWTPHTSPPPQGPSPRSTPTPSPSKPPCTSPRAHQTPNPMPQVQPLATRRKWPCASAAGASNVEARWARVSQARRPSTPSPPWPADRNEQCCIERTPPTRISAPAVPITAACGAGASA